MLAHLKMCSTCLEANTLELTDVSTLDFDCASFLHKLQMCVSGTLQEEMVRFICTNCVTQLRSSYKFRERVLLSQQILQKRKNEIQTGTGTCEGDVAIVYRMNVDGQLFESECLILNNDALNLMMMEENETKYVIDKPEPTDVNDNTCATNDVVNSSETEDVKECRKCDIKSFEQVYTEYPSDEEIKQVTLNGRKTKRENGDPDATFECYHCSTVFNKRWKLQKHISRVHTDVKKYICGYCKKAFKQSYHLREHLTSHTGERNYTCSFCSKTFQRISSLKRHSRSHEKAPGEKTKRTPFLCNICGKSFPYSNGVQRHMRAHLGIKNHVCSICHRRFTQSTHLHVHMRTHTGEKPYICETCGDAFSLNATLQKHMITHRFPSPVPKARKTFKKEVQVI
ncbi:hypothetical protein FQA39_LY08358 [Lamprigera yunnana]|nr:hypothetical protein FQA39_LY08358 [Lamprigera yunnana]